MFESLVCSALRKEGSSGSESHSWGRTGGFRHVAKDFHAPRFRSTHPTKVCLACLITTTPDQPERRNHQPQRRIAAQTKEAAMLRHSFAFWCPLALCCVSHRPAA